MTGKELTTRIGWLRWEHRRTVLTLCVLALFVTVFGRLALSPVVPDIAAEFGTSNTLIGGVLTGMWLTYALTHFPSGILADRFGDRLLISISVGGTGLTALLIAAAPTFWLFAAGVVLIGAVAGFHYSVGTALLTRIYDDTGTAIGIHNIGSPLAGLAAPIVVSWVAVRYGWRPAVALTAIVGIPGAVLVLHWIRPSGPRRPDSSMRDRFEGGPMKQLLPRPTVVFTMAIAVLTQGAWQGIDSFLPTFFVQYHGYSATFAGTLFAGYFVAQRILQIGVGIAADRFGRDVTIASCALAGIAGVGLLVKGADLVATVSGIVLLGLSMGHSPAVFSRFMDRMVEDKQGYGFGLFRTTYMIIAASGSVVLGTLADTFNWAVSLGSVGVGLAIVCCLLAVNYVFDLKY